MRVLTPRDHRVMPWKNGLGTTSEIVRVDDGVGALLWRVSLADVESDGPFSGFAGYDRVIATIAGAGMLLEHPTLGRSTRLAPLEPYAFSGDWETRCTLVGGPVRDFNLISRRLRVGGGLSVARLAAGERRALPSDAAFVHVLAGPVRLDGDEGERVVDASESVLASTPGELRHLAAGGGTPATALVVTISPRGAPAGG